MKKILLIVLLSICFGAVWAQGTVADSVVAGTVTVSKDPRIELLGKKMAEYNESLSTKLKSTRGYRLMVLSTNDRTKALQLRTQLLQLYPDQSVYMVFQSPFIKLKFGNFLDKKEADGYRKQLVAAKIISGNIYIVPEMVEVRADKISQAEDNNKVPGL